MPGMLSLMAIILTLVVSFYFTKKQDRNQIHQEHNVLTENIKFICPVHALVIQDVPGNCPVCGTQLIESTVQYNNTYDTSIISYVRPVIISLSLP